MKNTFQRITRYCGLLLLIGLASGLGFAAESTPTMSKDEAKQLIAKASTPEERDALHDDVGKRD